MIKEEQMTEHCIEKKDKYRVWVEKIGRQVYVDAFDLLGNFDGKHIILDLESDDARKLAQALKELADEIDKEKK